MKKISLLSVLMIFIQLLPSCRDDHRTSVLKLGHGLDTDHPVHKSMIFMAERVKQDSGGRMEIEIYPSRQLGTEKECVELLQIGSLDMTKVSASVMENFAPAYKVLSLPFIFDNREHSYRVLDGEAGREILQSSEKYWLKGLTFYDAGSRSFYTKNTAVRHPDDLKGLSIRVMKSPTAIEMVENFGGSPAPISWGELYTSLQTGRVDAAENNPPSFYHSHHYEVCRFYCLDEHTSVPDVLLISTSAWKRLDQKEKDWLKKAATASSLYQRDLWLEDEKESMKKIKAAGVTVIPADSIDREAFKKSVADMYTEASLQVLVEDLIQMIRHESNDEKDN